MRQQDTVIDLGPVARGGNGVQAGLGATPFALLFALLIFAAFPQVILGLQTFVVRDFGFFAYPLAHYQRECFWKGELPLWNPYNYCGTPFLAQWNTMPLYPPALIYLLFPLSWSLGFFCLVHLLWAGLGMYWLARRWTGSLLAASVAGLVFGFNGFSLNLLMWPSHIATLSWMPWVVLTAERGWRDGGRAIGGAALVGALQMLAGGPETVFFTWSICGTLWVAHLAALQQEGGVRAMRGPLWRFPALVVWVAGLAAVQLLPFLDLAAHSQRGAGFADARWSMPARGWANFFAPMVFGSTVKQGLFFQHGQYWTSSYYLGIGTLTLAWLGIRSVRNLRVWLLGGGALLALMLATGDQTLLSRCARQFVPQLTLMTYPVKFLTVVVFALPLLAAFGMAWLERPAGPSRRNRLLASGSMVATVLVLVLFWAWRWPLANDDTGAALRNGLSRAVFLIATVILLAVLLAGRFSRLPGSLAVAHLLPVLLLVVFWFDVWTHEPPQNPVVPGWVYQPGLARKQLALNPEPGLGRSRVMVSPQAEQEFRKLVLQDVKDNYLVKRLGFFADCNLLDAVPKADGFFSLCPRECGELNSALYVSGATYGAGLPDFLSVSHITAAGESVKWMERKTFLPLATGGQPPVFLDDTNALRTLLSAEFDPRKTIVLSLEAKPLVTSLGQAPVRVVVKPSVITACQVELEVEAAGPALVVLGQTYYHPWRVYVDGRKGNLLRANYAFQAVQVPAGYHHVRLRYEDRLFEIGAAVSGLALAVCIAGVLYPAVRRRAPAG